MSNLDVDCKISEDLVGEVVGQSLDGRKEVERAANGTHCRRQTGSPHSHFETCIPINPEFDEDRNYNCCLEMSLAMGVARLVG
jgi:hypothetical protein